MNASRAVCRLRSRTSAVSPWGGAILQREGWLAARSDGGYSRLALDELVGLFIAAEPLAPVDAHVVDQRHERQALLGEGVFDPRRHLGIRLAMDDPLLLERPQPQRQRARADPAQ